MHLIGVMVLGFFASVLLENPVARWLMVRYYRMWRAMLRSEMIDTQNEMMDALEDWRPHEFDALQAFWQQLDRECKEIDHKLAALQPQPPKGNTP